MHTYDPSRLRSKENTMFDCTVVTREMLGNPIEIRVDGGPVGFDRAKSIADRAAREVDEEAMLLSWFDKGAGRYSPDVVCCGTEKPTWLVYAESRGGSISVDINNQEYVFVYRGGGTS